MKPDESLGQEEFLLPIFKTLMIPVKFLELVIQLLILGVTRTFLAQFSVAKGIGHDFLLLQVIALFQVIINFIPTRISQAQDQLSEDAM